MGSGASLQKELEGATDEQIKASLGALSDSDKEKVKAALTAAAGPNIPVPDFEAMFGHKGAFSADGAGPAPDYTKPEGWYWYGGEGTEGPELLPDGVDRVPNADRPADCFYIHPSSYYGTLWNQPVAEMDGHEITDYYMVTEASAFTGSCRVYAPKFRQAQLAAIGPFGEAEGRNGVADVAYGDIKAAFEHYLKDRSDGRPLVLVSHSQGSHYMTRLLYDYVEGKDLLKQVVGIYAFGAWVPLNLFEGEKAVFKDIKLAKAADSHSHHGCYISFTCEVPETVAAHGAIKEAKSENVENIWYGTLGHKCGDEYHRADGVPVVCTNPLTWSANGMGGGAPEDWQGMLKLFPNHVTWKGGPILDADTFMQCMMMEKGATGMKINSLGKLDAAEVQGMMDAESLGKFEIKEDEKTGDLQIPKLPAAIAGSELSSMEWMNVNLFWFNIRANVEKRVKAFKA
jgi:hypothetical protein